MLNKEKDKIASVQQKEQHYKAQLGEVTREIKQTTKDVYEWEKLAVKSGGEVESLKERNQEVMQAI